LHAKGGLGEVFLAEDTELNRPVALKRIQHLYADEADSRPAGSGTGGIEP
jgi:hypothetical protein